MSKLNSLAALRAIHGAIVDASAEQQLLEEVGKAVVEAAGYACAAVAFCDETGEALRTVSARGAPDATFAGYRLLPAERTDDLVGALRLGRPWVAPPQPNGTGRRGRPGKATAGAIALAVLPLVWGTQTLGALLVGDSAADTFTGDELDFLQGAPRAWPTASPACAAQPSGIAPRRNCAAWSGPAAP